MQLVCKVVLEDISRLIELTKKSCIIYSTWVIFPITWWNSNWVKTYSVWKLFIFNNRIVGIFRVWNSHVPILLFQPLSWYQSACIYLYKCYMLQAKHKEKKWLDKNISTRLREHTKYTSMRFSRFAHGLYC